MADISRADSATSLAVGDRVRLNAYGRDRLCVPSSPRGRRVHPDREGTILRFGRAGGPMRHCAIVLWDENRSGQNCAIAFLEGVSP